MTYEYDVIIVGAGAGGGVAACVLAEAGKRVLLIERGRERTYADSGHRDHLRNHRLQSYGVNTGPQIDDNPRIFIDEYGNRSVVWPHQPDYHNNAATVGSGTFVYGGLAWRFHPDDFRMASRYGVPKGSSLADWPFGYDELEPWYEKAENEIGVSGEGNISPHGGRREGDYPMPPIRANATTKMLQRGAARLGISTFPPPLLINTVPRVGRDACIQCGSCVGFPCPSNAKNGTQNTVIPRAIATGKCELVTETVGERIATDDKGQVIGVDVVSISADGALSRQRILSRAVVLSAGAIESARLLLLSATRREPNGLGNNLDLVGRNLQGHYYPTAFGLFDEDVQDSRGPGVTIATCDFSHGNEGIIGGAMLADDFTMLPIIFWKSALPEDLPRYGLTAKHFMRDNFRRVAQVKGPVHEIPEPNCRVQIDAGVKDVYSRPVAKLSGIAHPETLRTTEFILEKAHGWLRASGATKTWGLCPPRKLSAGQHQAGTCRMGTDLSNSVTDAFGRVWGHDNLFVSDASLHPTNGGYNPVLTIMALVFRNSTYLSKLF